MMEYVENLLLINVLHNAFMTFLGIQILGLLMSVFIIFDEGVIDDIEEFMEKYWDEDYIWDNIDGIALWAGSVLSYLYLLHFINDISDIRLSIALEKHPYVCWYVILMTFFLLLYTIVKTLNQISRTQEICDFLHTFSVIKKVWKKLPFIASMGKILFKKTIFVKVLSGPVGWIMAIGYCVIPFMVERKIKSTMGENVMSFVGAALLEYSLRNSIVILSIYGATSELIFW